MYSNPFPIAVSNLEPWLPHRAPMVWIDEVTHASAAEGECAVQIKSGALYMDIQGVRQSSLIEWIAQSFGYIRAAQHVCELLPANALPSRVFLAAIKDARYVGSLQELKVGDKVKIRIGNIKEIKPITLFDGKVYSPGGALLFEAKIRVYSE